MSLTIDERIALGIDWLDHHDPKWIEKIDLDTLNMGHDRCCVLGQLYGNYEYLLRNVEDGEDDPMPAVPLFVTEEEPEDRGFIVTCEANSFDNLTREWKRAIRAARRFRNG